MWTHSFNCADTTALQQKLDSVAKTAAPTLGLVFCSATHSVEGIRQLFAERNIDLVGCTTAGEIVDQRLYENSIAVLLMDLSPD